MMNRYTLLFLAITITKCICVGASLAKISQTLHASLTKSTRTAEVLISFGGTGNTLAIAERGTYANIADKRLAIVEALKQHSARQQASALSLLSKYKNLEKVEILWITNQVYVRAATAEVVNVLAELEDVTYIQENEYIPLEESEVKPGKSQKESGILAEWGVENIRAHLVWAHPNGNTGEGSVIATIDTGARGTHEALRDNYGGLWYDPYDDTTVPHDQNGHGTHTISTIAGRGGVGVAPGAKWIACRGCDTSSCGNAQLLLCGQWIYCPNDGSCSAAPDFCSNSWGGGRGNNFFDVVIQTWHTGNIIPIFSTGGSGLACNTVISPADSVAGVLGISSTTISNALSTFSARGPSIFGDIKPDIVAPGSNINAAYHTSDNAYAVLSGTAMACPHAAGVIALLRSHRPNITYAQIKELLERTAYKELTPTGLPCGGINETLYPNHSFGVGKIDALDAFNGA